MITVSVSVDAPDLEQGIRFYTDAFGFSKVAEPYPGVVVLSVGNFSICLLEKRAGTKPSINTQELRHYERHWTPVHMDIHVEDFNSALEKALKAGATKEQFFENPEHGSVAMCSDPFGNGFCLIEKRH
jgi:predicted enzyme related to lactoylglutathione lyase